MGQKSRNSARLPAYRKVYADGGGAVLPAPHGLSKLFVFLM